MLTKKVIITANGQSVPIVPDVVHEATLSSLSGRVLLLLMNCLSMTTVTRLSRFSSLMRLMNCVQLVHLGHSHEEPIFTREALLLHRWSPISIEKITRINGSLVLKRKVHQRELVVHNSLTRGQQLIPRLISSRRMGNDSYDLLMEYVPYTVLSHLNLIVSTEQLRSVFEQLSLVLVSLTKMKLVHGDLYPRNVFFMLSSTKILVKLGDFGSVSEYYGSNRVDSLPQRIVVGEQLRDFAANLLNQIQRWNRESLVVTNQLPPLSKEIASLTNSELYSIISQLGFDPFTTDI